MKINRLSVLCAAALVALFSCTKEESLSDQKAELTVSESEVSFEKESGSAQITVTSNRDWKVQYSEDWISVTVDGRDAKENAIAASAKAVNVTITVLENTSFDRTASITFNGGTLAKKTVVVNQKGASAAIADGDGSKEKPFSASQAHDEALKLASGTTSSQAYYIRGIIHKIASKHEDGVANYGNGSFYISNDGQASDNDFYCFQVLYIGGAKFTSVDQVKVGDDVVVYGKITNYNGTTETVNKGAAYIYSLNGETGGEVIGGGAQTVDQIIKLSSGDAEVSGRVIANATSGFVINDGTQNNLFVEWKTSVPEVGSLVTVKGSITTYKTCARVIASSVETYEGTVAATPEQSVTNVAENMITSFDCKGSAVRITISGTLTTTQSGGVKYYNLEFETVSKPGGSVYTNLDIDEYIGKRIKVTGYYAGSTNSWFMVVTEKVEEDNSPMLMVSTDKLNVSAKATSASFNVTANTAWTATVDPSTGYTVTPSSGTGNAEVTVSFAANTATEPKVATVTLTATGVDPVTVTITQAKYVDGGAAGYTKVTSNLSDWSGDYVIVYDKGDSCFVFNGTDAEHNYDIFVPEDGVIEYDGIPEKSRVTIEKVSGGYSVMINGKYIGGSSSKNTISFSTTAIATTLSYETDHVQIQAGGYLQFNDAKSNGDRFRYYKGLTQKGVQLYRMNN